MIKAIKKEPLKFALSALVLYAGFRVVKVGESIPAAIESTGAAINPVNPENIFYRATNAVGSALSGDEHFTLGGALYDVFNAPGKNDLLTHQAGATLSSPTTFATEQDE
jgi:hypothetical protein